jgi:hypothetical protein
LVRAGPARFPHSTDQRLPGLHTLHVALPFLPFSPFLNGVFLQGDFFG